MTDSEKLDLVLEKITDVDEKVESLDKRVESLDKKVETLDRKVEILDRRVETLDKRVIRVENDVRVIKLTIENEIRVNIQRVAEGHLDLSRNLNECIKLSNDVKDRQEIQDMYINMHNNKIRTLEAACQ
ncbi:MAG: hypothetical protein K2J04_08725 [Lachnospiraceae bacterium]|nr:hypothetical protein [Lachnospiraceae bacterium]